MLKAKNLIERLEAMCEISDELKQRVYDKRKEQVDKAQAKLDKTAKLTKMLKPITITFEAPVIEVCEFSYKEGDLDFVEMYDGSSDKTIALDISDVDKAIEQFVEALWETALYHPENVKHDEFGIFFDSDSNALYSDLFFNNHYKYPSKKEWKEWKKGNQILYIGRYQGGLIFEKDADKEIFINFANTSKLIDLLMR